MAEAFFRRIVVGLQFDEAAGVLWPGSRLALECARFLAKASDAHVTLFHSHRLDERWDEDQDDFVPAGLGGASAAQDVLETAAASLRGDGIESDVVNSPESATLGLIRRVLEEQADLAIVGKRDQIGHDEGRRMGSVSASLLRGCPGCVLVVKPRSDVRFDTIVAATDLTAVGDAVVRTAASLASRVDAKLHVVHALRLTLEVEMEGPDAARAYAERKRGEAIAQIEPLLGSLRGSAEIHVGVTTPTRAVLDAEKRLEPDLVVMGTVARGGIAGLLTGNTAERLLGRLDCSILAIKPEDFVSPVTTD